MTDLSCGPDPVVERILQEAGDVNKAITKLIQLHWTRAEAEQELRRCLSSGARNEQKAKRRSVPRTG